MVPQIRHGSFNTGEYTARIEEGPNRSPSGNATLEVDVTATSGSRSIGIVVGKINGAGAPNGTSICKMEVIPTEAFGDHRNRCIPRRWRSLCFPYKQCTW